MKKSRGACAVQDHRDCEVRAGYGMAYNLYQKEEARRIGITNIDADDNYSLQMRNGIGFMVSVTITMDTVTEYESRQSLLSSSAVELRPRT